MEEESTFHVAMFPFFAFGHISPFVQLSNKLSTRGVRVTFLSAPNNIRRTRSSLSPHVQVVPVEIPHVPGLPSEVQSTAEGTPAMAELLKLALDQMEPQVRSLLGILKPHLVIHDFSHKWMGRVGGEVGFKSLLFSVFASVSSSLLMVPSRSNIKQMIQNSAFDDEQQLVNEMKKLPPGFPSTSIKSIPTYLAKDFLYVFKSFGSPSVFDRVMGCMSSCDAIVYKSCIEMEGPYIGFIKSQYQKPVLLAGPVVPEPPVGELEEKSATWLGSFPAKSVVFSSFGSETFLTTSQVRELVEGIEMTGFPFMVVLNFQSDDKEGELRKALPEGFVERVKGRGVVCTGWVQQQHILGHESVGCFVNHAGFSSITEGLVSDCQLVFLPLKGDQFVNAKLMGEDLKLGVEVRRDDEDGSFIKEDICKAVKRVMVEDDDESGRLVRANQEKWRKFLLDKEVHEGYMNNFVKDLKDLAFQTPKQE
ncbi:hypothetical protein Sjap_009544 [Stephania japonica]|uniref:Glycosyltransferase n=1 Tax=Stephania japonica TaxID=461633 RepID=A0AAP0JSJ3_9MAGN